MIFMIYDEQNVIYSFNEPMKVNDTLKRHKNEDVSLKEPYIIRTNETNATKNEMIKQSIENYSMKMC